MASNLVEYYRNLAARGGTQAAMTSARPTRPALSPEVLERYESGLSRGSSSATGAATPTGTTTAPALTTGTSAPALTSFESLSTQPSITGSGEATGYSATDTSGPSPSNSSLLGESMAQSMATMAASGALKGGAIATIATGGNIGFGILGAGTGAFSGAVKGAATGAAKAVLSYFMGETDLENLLGLQHYGVDPLSELSGSLAGVNTEGGADLTGTLSNMAAESYGPGVLGNALASMAQSGYIGAANIYGALGGGSVGGNASNVGSNPGGAANSGDGGYGGGDVY